MAEAARGDKRRFAAFHRCFIVLRRRLAASGGRYEQGYDKQFSVCQGLLQGTFRVSALAPSFLAVYHGLPILDPPKQVLMHSLWGITRFAPPDARWPVPAPGVAGDNAGVSGALGDNFRLPRSAGSRCHNALRAAR